MVKQEEKYIKYPSCEGELFKSRNRIANSLSSLINCISLSAHSGWKNTGFDILYNQSRIHLIFNQLTSYN